MEKCNQLWGYTHIHHKIPKSLGGTNDEQNLADLLVIDHIITHEVRYRMFGFWQDKVAYQGMSGQLDTQEILREKARLGNLGRDNSGKKNPMFGKKHTEKTKRKIGDKSINRNWNRIIGSGSKNPNAKKVSVVLDGEIFNYDCLKEFYNENQHIPYSTLKSIALDGRYSKKYNLEITYA